MLRSIRSSEARGIISSKWNPRQHNMPLEREFGEYFSSIRPSIGLRMGMKPASMTMLQPAESTIPVRNDAEDPDPLEPREWLESLEAVVKRAGKERGQFLMKE